MKKSVAIIGTRGYPSHYGGFETAVRKLAPYLADRAWDVVVYGRSQLAAPNDGADSRVTSVITRGIESKALSTLSFGLTAVLDTLRRRPDVALVMNVANGFWLPLLRLRGIPTVVNVDGMEWERAKWGRLAKLVFKIGAWFTAKFGTALVFDSVEIARRWRIEFRREGYFIPYGGDELEALPVEPGLTAREYVLFVARLVPENSVLEFLQAAESLAPKWAVVIVGSSAYGSDYESRLSALKSRFPNIYVLGHISDDRRLHSLWQNAGAYFHGHSVGGTNPALIQAMASGSPIVARDSVYNREVLGDSGIYVAPDGPSIATSVARLIASEGLKNRLSLKAKLRARKFYSWEAVCRSYEQVLQGSLRNHGSKLSASSES